MKYILPALSGDPARSYQEAVSRRQSQAKSQQDIDAGSLDAQSRAAFGRSLMDLLQNSQIPGATPLPGIPPGGIPPGGAGAPPGGPQPPQQAPDASMPQPNPLRMGGAPQMVQPGQAPPGGAPPGPAVPSA